MIHLLYLGAKWLNDRFPPKLFVSVEQFNSLLDNQHKQKKNLDKISEDLLCLNTEMDSIKESIAAIKDIVSKSTNPTIAADKRRSDFIADGRMSD